MTRFRTFLLLILISLMVTLSIQLTEKISEQDIPAGNKGLNDKVDYSIEDFKLTMMDTQGKMQYHLSAGSMLHFKESDQTLLQEPHIALFRNAGEHWKIEASEGHVGPRGKDVLLQGKVQIQRSATGQQKPYIITTETLKISPKSNSVSTQDYIQFKGDGLSIRAKGMLANLDQETIQLLAKVRGSYAP